MLCARRPSRPFASFAKTAGCAWIALWLLGVAGCSQQNDSAGSTAPASKNESQSTRDGWVPLFNGHDLTGWKPQGNAVWSVEKGQLVGKQGENFAPGDLLTEKDYGDFELTCTYRIVWPANSGIWFRYQSAARNYQADILEWPSPVCYSGTLYCQGKMFIAMNTDPSIVDKNGWNTMRVRAEGDHVQLWLNDHPTADLHDTTTDHGRIGFQIHPGNQFGTMRIMVKEMKIRELGRRP